MKHVIFPGSDDVLIDMFSELKDKNNIVERGMYLKYDNKITKIRNKLSYHKPWSNFFITILDNLTFNISKLYFELIFIICLYNIDLFFNFFNALFKYMFFIFFR